MAHVRWHLIDASSAVAPPAGLAMAAARVERDRAAGLPTRVMLAGGRSLLAEARAVGLADSDTPLVGVPGGRPWRNLSAVARLFRGQREPDQIHCWSVDALWACQLLKPRVGKTLTLMQGPGRETIRWLRRAMWLGRRNVVVETPWQAIAARLLAGGVDARQVTRVAPLKPAALAQPLTRAGLRQRWRDQPDGAAESVVPGERREPTAANEALADPMVALLSDPPEAGDAAAGSMIIGLTRESMQARPADECLAGEPRLLIHPRQWRGLRARYNLTQLGRQHLLVQEPALDRPWTVLPGCDAAVVLGEAPMALAPAMQAQLPIIAEAWPLNLERLAEYANARLVPAGVEKRAAHALEQALTADVPQRAASEPATVCGQ